MAKAPVLTLEGAKRFQDTGGVTHHRVTIENAGEQPIVLFRLESRRFAPPDFKALNRMKAPGSHWSLWRNVLGPGQRTTIQLSGGRLKAGAHALSVTLEYAVASKGFVADHIKQVVATSDGLSAKQLHYGPSAAQPQPVWVTYEPERFGPPKALTESWTLNVSPDPVVAALKNSQSVDRFAPDLPYFGYVVSVGGRSHQVVDGSLRPLGVASFEALEALGRELKATGRARVRATKAAKALVSAFAPRPEPVMHVATARVRRWQAVDTWQVFEVDVAGLPKLWRVLEDEKAELGHDFHDGVVLDLAPLTRADQHLRP